MATFRSHVLVCGGTGCTSGGSDKILETLREGIKANVHDKDHCRTDGLSRDV